jgi:hypothetical protein
MSDMRKLLESMTKFAGEPAQRPGDQVRGTERAVKKKSGQHPFQGRLVGEDNIFKELEKQLVEGDVERRLHEQFEQFNEFAPDDGDSGGEDDALRNYARMWWAGDEATQMQIEKVLARMGWEIGEDEGGYDNGGVFVVRAGDENGNSYQSWAAEDLTEDWKSKLAGAALAGAMALGAGGAHARVGADYVDNPDINRLTGKPKVTQVEPGTEQPVAAVKKGPGFSAEYLKSVIDGTHPRPLISKERAQELLQQQQQTTNEQGVAEGIFGFGTKVPTKDKVEPADDFSAKLLDRRQKQQAQDPKEKVYRSPEEYRQEKERDVEEGIFGFMSKPEPTKKKEPPDAFADKLDAQRIKNLTQHKPTLADKKKPNVRVITRYTEENVTENEGDPEGLPHLTKELLTHIVDQVGKEGAHAIVKSLTWGDGAAKELLHLIVNDLEDDIRQGIEKQNYKKSPDKITELGANNPPQPTAAVAGNPAGAGQAAPVDPKATAALKQNLMKLKTSVPGLDITKATNAMTKADTGVPLTPGDKNVTSAIAPQLANVMKNPQMASSLKMMIDKANQQEKAAAAKPPGTV